MSKVKTMHINDITLEYAEELAQILNKDTKLLSALGSKKRDIDGNEFLTTSKDWAISRHSDMFAIILDEHAIGTISLSHQDITNRKARIGYWISSEYWGNGYTSQAFSEVLNFARTKGIENVSASIKEDNLASKRIWEKYGACMEFVNERYVVSINL